MESLPERTTPWTYLYFYSGIVGSVKVVVRSRLFNLVQNRSEWRTEEQTAALEYVQQRTNFYQCFCSSGSNENVGMSYECKRCREIRANLQNPSIFIGLRAEIFMVRR